MSTSFHGRFVPPSRTDRSAVPLLPDLNIVSLFSSPSVLEFTLAPRIAEANPDELRDGSVDVHVEPTAPCPTPVQARCGRRGGRGSRGSVRGMGGASARCKKYPSEGRTFLNSPPVKIVDEKTFKADLFSETARL